MQSHVSKIIGPKSHPYFQMGIGGHKRQEKQVGNGKDNKFWTPHLEIAMNKAQ